MERIRHTISKTNKEPKQKGRLGTASNKITWRLGVGGGVALDPVCGQQTNE